jgi:hypothetical protein
VATQRPVSGWPTEIRQARATWIWKAEPEARPQAAIRTTTASRRNLGQERKQVCEVRSVDDGGVDRAGALVDHQQADRDRSALFGKGPFKSGMERHTRTLQRALEQFRSATLGLEAIGHDGDEAAIGFQNTQSCRQVAGSRGGIFKASGVARKWRVHQRDAGALRQMGANAGSIKAGHLRGGEQVTQDLLTDRIDFVELEAGSMSGPDRQHSGAGAGFEHGIVWLDVGKMCRQPSQPKRRRKVLMLDLLLAANRLSWQAGFEIIEKGECLLDG